MTNLFSAVLGLSFSAGLNAYATVLALGLFCLGSVDPERGSVDFFVDAQRPLYPKVGLAPAPKIRLHLR
jgi:hypothetical protein